MRTAVAWRVTVGLWVLVGVLGGSSSLAEDASEPAYRFGVVPQFDQRKLFRTWRPVLQAVERRTGIRFRIVGTPEIPSFERELLEGKFDCAYMNPYHFVLAHRRQGYEALVRDYARQLQGILVVRKDSGIDSPSELNGRAIAFPAPNALGASLLMRAQLARDIGIVVQPRYVKTHTSVYLNVAKNLLAAGGGVQRTLDAQPEPIRRALRVVYRTRPIPSHPIACHPRVPLEQQRRIRAAFVDLGEDPRLAKVLARIPMHDIGEADTDGYAVMGDWGLEAFYVSP